MGQALSLRLDFRFAQTGYFCGTSIFKTPQAAGYLTRATHKFIKKRIETQKKGGEEPVGVFYGFTEAEVYLIWL